MTRYRFERGVWAAWFFEECYSVPIHLIWPAQAEVRERFLKKKFNVELDNNREYAASCAWLYNPGLVIVIALSEWHETPTWVAALSHEAAHATENILFNAGMDHTKKTREAFAYLQESIMRRCLEILRFRK